MNLQLQARGISSHQDVDRFVKCRAELALGPWRDRVDAVNVFVERRGDTDCSEAMRCLVVVKSSTRPDVVIECLSANLYLAIHQAVDEAGWYLADSCAREQDALLDRQLEALCGSAAMTATGSAISGHRAA